MSFAVPFFLSYIYFFFYKKGNFSRKLDFCQVTFNFQGASSNFNLVIYRLGNNKLHELCGVQLFKRISAKIVLFSKTGDMWRDRGGSVDWSGGGQNGWRRERARLLSRDRWKRAIGMASGHP